VGVTRLVLHPQSQAGPVDGIDVDVSRTGETVALRYVLCGDIRRVRLPTGAGARADDLWKHTCFEAFIGASGAGYFEFNFTPSKDWAAYRFEGYRAGMRNSEIAAPCIAVAGDDGVLDLAVQFTLPALDEAPRLGLTAVIEGQAGEKSYWALAHPPGAPDFHHADCFALELPPA
jgi:hypothetical protein